MPEKIKASRMYKDPSDVTNSQNKMYTYQFYRVKSVCDDRITPIIKLD